VEYAMHTQKAKKTKYSARFRTRVESPELHISIALVRSLISTMESVIHLEPFES
jgi:hypothetical protein